MQQGNERGAWIPASEKSQEIRNHADAFLYRERRAFGGGLIPPCLGKAGSGGEAGIFF